MTGTGFLHPQGQRGRAGRGSGLCWEVPASRRHCSRTRRSPCARSAGPALLPRAGPGTGTGGRQPRSATLLFVYQARHAAGLLSLQPLSLPASRPARDKGACGGLAARRAGPRFPRRQLLARLAKAAVLSRPRSLRAERGPGRTPSVFICKADPVPAPSSRPGQAGGRGVSGGQWAGARASARLRAFVAGASCRWVNGAEAIGEGRQKWALKEGVSAGRRDKGQNTHGRRGTDGDGRRRQLGGGRGAGAGRARLHRSAVNQARARRSFASAPGREGRGAGYPLPINSRRAGPGQPAGHPCFPP